MYECIMYYDIYYSYSSLSQASLHCIASYRIVFPCALLAQLTFFPGASEWSVEMPWAGLAATSPQKYNLGLFIPIKDE